MDNSGLNTRIIYLVENDQQNISVLHQEMSAFDQTYFMDGIRTGISNFENYAWCPDRTISMVTHLMRYLRIKPGDRFLDCGAALGMYVKALRLQGVEAYGYDVSQFAVEHCDAEVKPFMSNYLNGARFDFVMLKDVAEHIPQEELMRLISKLCIFTDKKLFFIVPLAFKTGGDYVHPKEENDKTHIHRFTLHDWIVLLQECASNFVVTGGYRYPGLKPGAFEVSYGYGFITMERV